MKELIKELRAAAKEIADAEHSGWGNVCNDAANTLEQLTDGDVELPEPDGFMDQSIGCELAYTKDQLIDYGNRCAARAVLAERDRCLALSAYFDSYGVLSDAIKSGEQA